MNEPTRLFDILEYQLEHYPKRDMLAAKENGVWKQYATKDVICQTLELSAGLLHYGIGGSVGDPENQDKIAILSENRPEWMILDLACQQIGAILTPIYPTIHVNELEYILKETEIKLVFVSNYSLYEKLIKIKDSISCIRDVFTFDKVKDVMNWRTLFWQPNEADKTSINHIKASVRPHDLATIIYTSGTTGTPKGVMLSHHNILSNVLSCRPCLPVNEEGRALSFLPLNHVYERMVTYLYIYAGVSIYYAESMETIGENLREVKPSIFTTVPRLLEKVYERILAKGLELKGVKKKLFFWAVELGRHYEINAHMGAWYRFQLKLARKLIFKKWKEALGGNIQAIVTGSAACQVRLLRLFTAAGVNVLEGYGLTETSPVISVNRMEIKDRKFGTVGPVIDHVEVKISEEGTILCKGSNVMMGYYKNPEITSDAIRDGWFDTGDIGVLSEGKFLKITDRKKELFKTSGGKYVAPLPIENKMKESPYIEQIMVVGANLKYTAALIIPDFKRLTDWRKASGKPELPEEKLIRQADVIELIRKEVTKYNQFFNHVEQIKKFELLSEEWTIESEELTPTLKLKRKIIEEKYKQIISEIYE